MRIILISTYFLFLIGCAASQPEQPTKQPSKQPSKQEVVNPPQFPSWYDKVQPRSSNEVIGFGYGKTRELARNMALQAIAEQIAPTDVQHSFIIQEQQTQHSASESFQSSALLTTKVDNQAEVDESYRLKQAFLEGFHFVAYATDKSSVRAKLLRKLGTRCTRQARSIEPKAKGLASYTLFARNLAEDGCPRGWQLVRKNKSWTIQTSGEIVTLPKNQIWRLTLGLDKGENLLLTDAEKKPMGSLKEGDSYFVWFNKPLGRNFYAFHVNQLGQVYRLNEEYSAKAEGKEFFYPNPEFYDGMVAEHNAIKQQQHTSSDMLIAAECPNPLYTSFHSMGEDATNFDDESLYKLGDLLQVLENCEVQAKSLLIYD